MSKSMPLHRSLLCFLIFLSVAAARVEAAKNDWAESPEAYFLTVDEKKEWATLQTDAAREEFKRRYWLRRDPTPGTAVNEFRDVVMGRIAAADKRFGFQGTVGSRGARGLVFIVFGSPALTRDKHVNGITGDPSSSSSHVLEQEGLEYGVSWTYNRERTPKILAALDNRPDLTVDFIIDPNRRRDSLQNPGLINRYRDVIAEKSIITRDVGSAPAEVPAGAINPNAAATDAAIPAPVPMKGKSGADFDELPGKALPAEAAAVLNATAPAVAAGPTRFGRATLGLGEEAISVFWLFVPDVDEGRNDLMFYGVVKSKAGDEVARVARPVRSGSGFTTAGRGVVAMTKMRIPPGSYRGVFVVADGQKQVLARAESSFNVPKSDETSVAPLLIASGLQALHSGMRADVTLGPSMVEVRADSSFRPAESLWYLVQLANPADLNAVVLEHRIRHGATEIGAPVQYKANLEKVGEGQYVSGFEVPLSNLAAGDYTLYVTIRDGAREELRRADFRIVTQ